MLFQMVSIAFMLTSVIIAFLIYHSNANNVLKFIALPATVVCAIGSILIIVQLAGAPLERMPIGKWDYIHHKANVDNTISLWVWSDRFQDQRLYRFPYDRETMKKLDQAKEEQTQTRGRRKHTGEFKKEKEGNDEQIILYMERGTARTENVTK